MNMPIAQGASPLPPNVPPGRVVDFDIFAPPGVEHDYFGAWQTLQAPGVPAVVWTTANGGHWIATRGSVIRQLWGDTERLSNEVLAVTPGLGEAMRFIPLQQDPPEHTPFRNAVMRGFGSAHIVALEPAVIDTARELIAGLVDRGGCEFVEEFAEILPINIFLTLIGVPVDDRAYLRQFGKQLTRPDGSMTVEQLRDAVDTYLEPYVRQRLEDPGPDLFSRILSVPINGRDWTFDEAQRMCRNLLFGGLDTVVAMIGMVTLHLARNPQDQRRLREEPSLIPAAADELMRRYPTVSVSRNVAQAFDIEGVTLAVGDIVYLPSVLHNLDPECFSEPETVDFGRGLNPVRHLTMGVGAHRCVGVGLARMEVIVFLREWLAGIPEFRLDSDSSVHMRGGNVGALTKLPLLWDAV